MKKHFYFENLDGFRFFCFLSVFFYHCFHTEHLEIKQNSIYHFVKKVLVVNGCLGVNFFFVLSGFLITYLLIEEKRLNGQINLINFYTRRTLRIWPLFFLCVFFGFCIFPYLKLAQGEVSEANATLPAYFTFTNNFEFIYKGVPDCTVLSVLWSIAIEEQFYLVWPIIIYFVPVNKLYIPFLSVIIVSIVFRYFNFSYEMHEFHTLSCMGDLSVGATAALLMLTSKKFETQIKNLNQTSIYFVYIIFILIYFFRQPVLWPNPNIRIFERLFIAIILALIILEQSFSSHSFFKMSKLKNISSLGKYTYGMYCLHFIGIIISTNLNKKLNLNTELWQVLILDTLFAFLITIGISKLSYDYYEKPFLKLKERFSA